MFDALKVLGAMVEHQSAPSAANRFGAAVQTGSSDSLLRQIMAQLGEGGAQQRPDAMPGGMTGPGAAFGSGQAQGGLGGLLGNFADMAKRARVRRGRRLAATTRLPSAGLARSRARCWAAGAERWAAG